MARPRAKSVRFAEIDTYVRERTPSPTHSNSTLSSPELSSPLSLSPIRPLLSPQGDFCGGGGLPSSPSLSSVDGGALALDSCIAVPPPRQLPLFTYDLMRDPQGAASPAILPPLPKATLMRPAVTPPIAKMTIVVKTEAFQWSIEIKPKHSAGAYVAVKDVLYGIYDDLQTKLNPADVKAMSVDVQQRVVLACQKRCERQRKWVKVDEAVEGIRRIDFLYRDYRFKGIVLDPQINVWELKVEEHP